MEERQTEHEAVLGLPLPGHQYCRDARQQGGMRVHGTLRLTRGPRRVDDQRVVAGLTFGGGDGLSARGGAGQLLDEHDGRPGTEGVGPRAVADGEHRTGISDHVVDFGSGRRRAERHHDRTEAQHRHEGLCRVDGGAGAPQDAVARGDAPLGQGPGQRGCPRVERRRIHHARGILSVDQHRRVRMGRPHPGPHLGERPARRRGPPARPSSGGDERPHCRRPQVIVWRS